MEEEIDLRAYIAVLFRYKMWILGLALGAAVVAMAVSFMLPPTYEATALVASVTSRYAMRFDPRFETVDDVSTPYKAYPGLAMGDEVIATLLQELDDELGPDERSVVALRKMLDAKSGDDPSVVRLTARDKNPQRAALIANSWANVFARRMNDIYGGSQEESLFFESQLAEARDTLTQAEQALIDFQARNETAILQAQLNNKRGSLEQYLGTARDVRLVIQDAKSVRERLQSQDASARASLSDELASLLLEIDSLNSGGVPIQLQITGGQGLTNKTIGEQIAFLDALIPAMENKQAILEEEARALEPDILDLQKRVALIQTEGSRLNRTKEVAEETFTTLSRKVDEVRISAQNETGDVRVASQATAPEEPATPHKMLNTMVAGALGLALGVFGAFGVEYWRQGKPQVVTA